MGKIRNTRQKIERHEEERYGANGGERERDGERGEKK